MFPNRSAVRSLVATALAEQHDERAEARRFPIIANDIDAQAKPSSDNLNIINQDDLNDTY